MAISDKLTYLNTTKTLIREGLNNLGASLTSNDTFRSYVNVLNDLYDYLPKVTGSGTNVTLNDTKKGLMKITLDPSELSQSSTPSSSSPQDIHTISGSNKAVVNGKNLIQSMAKVGNTAYFNGYNSQELYPFSAGTYTLSYKNTNTTALYLKVSSGTQQSLGTNKTITFTANENFQLWFYRSGLTIEEFSEVQLEVGSTATTYEPYTSQEADIDLDTIEYCKIGNYEDKFIRNSGKNLLDITNWEGAYITPTGSITTDSSKINALFDGYIKAKPNTNYILSCNTALTFLSIGEYDTNKTFIQRDRTSNTTSNAITTTATTEYLRVTINYNNSSTITQNVLERIELMLEQGNARTSYEPYGNGTWYIKKNIGKVVLDGSESTWNGTDPFFVRLTTKGISNEIMGMSNYFLGTSNDNRATGSNIIYFDGDLCYIRHTTFSDLATFRTWLGTHNTDVYYVMASPTYTPITGTLAEQLENIYQKLLSYDGQTNISQVNNDLAFIINSSALQDLS